MDLIIGRENEKKLLEEIYRSNSAEFVALYGRRRVGKTYLVKNFFQSKKCIFFQTVGLYQAPIEEQISRFMIELGNTFYEGAPLQIPQSWLEAFEVLNKAIESTPTNKKIVLFLDEFPWMATPRSGVTRALEYYWNRHWSYNSQVKLVICGSSASWIIHKIVKNKGGFHNRLTQKILLEPFNLHDTYAYLKHIGYKCSYYQATLLFMVIGGVPFYLKQIKKSLSVEQNINKLFFEKDSQLLNEFDEIFASLFDDSEAYRELVMLIASSKEGFSRKIIEDTNKLTGKGGRLTRRLEDLEYAGFISSYLPLGHKKRGVFYRVSDNYCYFYLKWIYPIKNQLKQNPNTPYWKRIVGMPDYYSWLGYAFENICYKHLSQIKNALGIEEYSLAAPWRYMPTKNDDHVGAQIDILFDRSDNAITVCEIKFTEKPFLIDKAYANILRNKVAVFEKIYKPKKQVFLAMICGGGLKENMYSEDLIQGKVVLEDLFKK